MTVAPFGLTDDISAWLESIHRNLDTLDQALDRRHRGETRMAAAREALADAVAMLYGDGLIAGKNAEERDACLRRLTAAERYEVREAETNLADAKTHLERVRNTLEKDKATREAFAIRDREVRS